MPIDIQRRKSVMARSMKLGHCVCNPRQPCPCETFTRYNVCPCAGERMPPKAGPVALTRLVARAGCASKIGQADLLRILANLPPVVDPNVLVGAAAGDDAGVYRLDDRLCLVQTVDVFSPVVDDPYLFGQIAAANSLSDVYAMGGRPLTALSIVGFPIEELDGSILEEILRGGMDKLREADCALIGGHSINDPEIKCGFAVTGLIEAARVIERGKARPGDSLVLTKALGTGMIAFAAQIGRVRKECLDEVGASMAELNREAAQLMTAHGAHACTDVTGYGLAGHLVEMARSSGVAAEIDLEALPVFAAAAECLEQEVISGAVERNQEYSMAWVRVGGEKDEKDVRDQRDEKEQCCERGETGDREEDGRSAPHGGAREGVEGILPILYDPQTSGGLLIAIPEESARAFVAEMHRLGHAATSIIGRIVERSGSQREGEVVVHGSRLGNLIGVRDAVILETHQKERTDIMAEKKDECCASQPASRPASPARSEPCCSGESASSGADVSAALFTDFMKQANKEGLIDARTKKLIAIALSVAMRCKPCLTTHLRGALNLGIPKPEIEEAAWLGIAFAGSPAMMMYREAWREIES